MIDRTAPSVRFRTAEAADVNAIVELVESAYRGQASTAGWTTEAHLIDGQRTDAKEVALLIARPESEIVLAEIDDQLCGCCHLQWVSTEVAGFGMFAVDPRRQGRGVGRAVVAEACRRAVAAGSQRLQMSVIKQRADLIAWYATLGFLPTGKTQPFPYGDERFGRPRHADLEFLVLEGSCETLATR